MTAADAAGEEEEEDMEEELELGNNLETALALNRAYQEALRNHMSTIQSLLHKNREKQVCRCVTVYVF